jgi:hypothetical protein
MWTNRGTAAMESGAAVEGAEVVPAGIAEPLPPPWLSQPGNGMVEWNRAGHRCRPASFPAPFATRYPNPKNLMAWLITKYLITAGLVVAISEIAKRSDRLARSLPPCRW